MPGKPAKDKYQVLARRYRPKSFTEVLGQNPIIATLKNGIKNSRLAHAYLFSGPRGCGKTTIARLLAKAVNCQALTETFDPCNSCPSCQDINSGNSLDVIEIDGASNRGIDDIRQINETVGYTTATGACKIYIIDEVHMLTKEAFNALLKTLEEPPPTVKFFFATTEPHKVLPTILSRCQHFQLKAHSLDTIMQKLSLIGNDLKREVDPDALRMIATRAEGSLRDAESLFDQILAFNEGPITARQIGNALGLLPQDVFFQLDEAAANGNMSFAFEIVSKIFSEGKDPFRFLETLTDHFRKLVLVKLAGPNSECLELEESLKNAYAKSAESYQKHQLLSIFELCIESNGSLRQTSSPKTLLEGLLLKILRSYTKIPIDHLVERLIGLEKRIQNSIEEEKSEPKAIPKAILPSISEDPTPKLSDLPKKIVIEEKSEPKAAVAAITPSISEDPTPKLSDLPKKMAQAEEKPPLAPTGFNPRYETLLQFTAVELEGKIIKK